MEVGLIQMNQSDLELVCEECDLELAYAEASFAAWFMLGLELVGVEFGL